MDIDLAKKTTEICNEISTTEKKIEPMILGRGSFFPPAKHDYYFGFKQKKRKFQLFREPPVFMLEEKTGGVILTSLSREYDNKIAEIAKKNEFGYDFDETKKGFTFYL
jgi:hypothetical protein